MSSTNGHKKTAVLYCRVSTAEQARSGYSLAQQLEALHDYAASEGYEVVGEFKDEGWSGMSVERPALDELRDRVAAGGVSVVLAQDRDRFAREPAYHYLLKREFEEHGCSLRALNDRGDDSPEGELTDGILDQIAKFERAKITERTRRGKLRRAREGKVVPAARPDFGFNYNANRDNYVVVEEEMQIVRRIFYMVGVEGMTIRAVKRTFEREGLPSPNGKCNWSPRFIRRCILDDVYKAHSFEEVEPLVSAEVAAKLDPEKFYGIWWFNRERVTYTQVAEDGPDGRRYPRRAKSTPKPASQWIGVPTPDPTVPREWVDSAREAIAANKRTSKNGGRFWELSGGILSCASCGWKMNTSTVKDGRSVRLTYYYRCGKHQQIAEGCPNYKNRRADKLEPMVWAAVYDIMTNPEQLRDDLDTMIELKRNEARGDPQREAKAWLEKLSEVDRKRSAYQDQQAEGLITLDELRAKLTSLEETRKIAQRELEILSRRQEEIEELERDKDDLLRYYADTAPEALDNLTPEQRHHIYKMGRFEVLSHADGTIEITGPLVPNLVKFVKQDQYLEAGSGPRARRAGRYLATTKAYS